MLSTIALVVAGLSTPHQIGLAGIGAAFIVFALVSSFVLPRRNPNFPGKHVGWYVVVCVGFFVAMLAAVLVFGVEEKEEPKAAEQPPAQTTTPAESTTTEAPTTTSGGGESEGSAAAGKTVFASAGCGSCHTLKAASSSGNVGPNLDDLKPAEDAVENQVIHGGGGMPPFKDQLTEKQIKDVAAFVYASTHS